MGDESRWTEKAPGGTHRDDDSMRPWRYEQSNNDEQRSYRTSNSYNQRYSHSDGNNYSSSHRQRDVSHPPAVMRRSPAQDDGAAYDDHARQRDPPSAVVDLHRKTSHWFITDPAAQASRSYARTYEGRRTDPSSPYQHSDGGRWQERDNSQRYLATQSGDHDSQPRGAVLPLADLRHQHHQHHQERYQRLSSMTSSLFHHQHSDESMAPTVRFIRAYENGKLVTSQFAFPIGPPSSFSSHSSPSRTQPSLLPPPPPQLPPPRPHFPPRSSSTSSVASSSQSPQRDLLRQRSVTAGYVSMRIESSFPTRPTLPALPPQSTATGAMATTATATTETSTPPSSSSQKKKRKTRVCTAPDCDKLVVDHGVCIRHGGGRRCKIDGCDCRAQNRGLCWKHGGYTICKVELCGKRAKSRGMCWTHGGGTQCKTEGCSKIAVSRGHCWAHGGGKRCKVPACQKPAAQRTQDFCTQHHDQFCEVAAAATATTHK